MDFDIKEPSHKRKKSKKKKKERKLITLAIILLILSLGLFFAYPYLSKNDINKILNKDEPSKIKIVNQNSNERPIAVMIDNNIGNGLHAGLQDSYINYEIIVEGNLTRIMALYKDKDVSLIGPIRSSRHYFLDYALESDCIYTHYGWSPYAQKDIKALGVDNINGLKDDEPFWRDSKIKAPHNVFTSTSDIRKYISSKDYSATSNDWQLLNYSPDEISLSESETSQPASQVQIGYSNHQNRSYTYDEENHYYIRFMNGKPHLDKTTNDQLNYKNIIIEKVNNKNIDKEGRQDLDTTGEGTGYYITDGYAQEINWSKTSRKSKTRYTTIDGKELKVNDGNTFIQIVPITSTIDIE